VEFVVLIQNVCFVARRLFSFPFSDLTELYSRDAIRRSKRISNPGCYATSTQLLVAPLLKHLQPGALPTVFGVSGYSGAGTVTGPKDSTGRPTTVSKVTAESLHGGLRPYALTDHIHEREAGRHLSTLLPPGSGLKVAFVPAVGTWFSGIQSVLSMPLNGKITAKNVKELYEERYEGEKLIKILKGVPDLKDYENKHGWVVGGFQVHSEGDRAVVVVSTLCSQSLPSSANSISRVGWIISSRVPLLSASRTSISRWVTMNTLVSPWIELLEA
jgi:N-acetyl-gamma-glutamyl-phosphate reductase/acetylglutamate kinase